MNEVTVSPSGRITIPASYCRALGFDPGCVLSIDVTNGELVVRAKGKMRLSRSRRIRLLKLARDVFGSASGARKWLSAPQLGLSGAVPFDHACTDAGARAVESLLGRIEYGVLP